MKEQKHKLSELLLEYVDQEGSLYIEKESTAAIIKLAQGYETQIEFMKAILGKNIIPDPRGEK